MDAREMREAAAAKVAHYLDGLAEPVNPDDRSIIVTLAATTAIATDPVAHDADEMIAREFDHVLRLAGEGIMPQIDLYSYVHGRAAYYVALGALLEIQAVVATQGENN